MLGVGWRLMEARCEELEASAAAARAAAEFAQRNVQLERERAARQGTLSEAQALIAALRSTPTPNYPNDWKLSRTRPAGVP